MGQRAGGGGINQQINIPPDYSPFIDVEYQPARIPRDKRYVSGDYKRNAEGVIEPPVSGQGKTFFTAPQSKLLSKVYPHLSYSARRTFPLKEEPYYFGKNPKGGDALKGKINMTKAKYSLAIQNVTRAFRGVNSLMTDAGIDNDFREITGSFFIGDSSTPINKKALSGYKLGIARILGSALVSGAGVQELAEILAHYKTAVMLKRYKDFLNALHSTGKLLQQISEKAVPIKSTRIKALNFVTGALGKRAPLTINQVDITRGFTRMNGIKEKIQMEEGLVPLIRSVETKNGEKRRAALAKKATYWGVNQADVKKYEKMFAKESNENIFANHYLYAMQPSMLEWDTRERKPVYSFNDSAIKTQEELMGSLAAIPITSTEMRQRDVIRGQTDAAYEELKRNVALLKTGERRPTRSVYSTAAQSPVVYDIAMEEEARNQ